MAPRQARALFFSNATSDGSAANDDDPIVIAQCDVATAYLQADKFAPHEPEHFLKVKDPVTGAVRYFWQRGNLYGSSSAGVRWERTLNAWLTSKDAGFEQGKNEPCAFRHAQRGLTLLSYCDDLLLRGPRSQVAWFFDTCAQGTIQDQAAGVPQQVQRHRSPRHGRVRERRRHLPIDAELHRGGAHQARGIDVDKIACKSHVPMSAPITDMAPCSPEEAK